MNDNRFNAIKYSHRLQEAGLNQKIADVEAEQISNLMSYDVATKNDILLVRKDIEVLENRLLIKLGSLIVICTGIIGTLLGIMLKVSGN